MKKDKISHINEIVDVHMMNVGGKPDSLRRAEAFTRVIVSKELLRKLEKNELIKGNALMTANVAGIQAAQKTDELISLCHPIPITMVSIEMDIIKETSAIEIKSKVETHYRTGVETEKLTLIEWHYGL